MAEDPQSRSSRYGRAYETQVAAGLEQHGWLIKERKWREPLANIEIDIVAIDPDGIETWVECKGSLGPRAGAKRTDSAKKFIADAALIYALYPEDERRPYLLITSDLPEKETDSAKKWLDAAVRLGWCRLAHFAMAIEFL